MIKFRNGEAAGETLFVRRAPDFLRVVVDPRGNWDALDQVSDVPAINERIFVYRIDDATRSSIHVCGRGKGLTGWYAVGEYVLFEPQPTDAEIRGTAQWQEWATRQHQAELSKQ